MPSINRMSDMEKSSGATIVVGGVKMTMQEFRKLHRKPKKEVVRADNKTKVAKGLDDSLIVTAIGKFRSLCKPFNTLAEFTGNRPYRSFGKIHDKVLEPVRREWYTYSHRYRELAALVEKIENCPARKVKDIRDYTEQLFWKVEELSKAAMTLWKKYDTKKDWYRVNFGDELIYTGRCRKGTEQMYDYGLKQLMLEQPSFVIEKKLETLTLKAKEIMAVGAAMAEPDALAYKL